MDMKKMNKIKCKRCKKLLKKVEVDIGRSGKCFLCAPIIKGIYPVGTCRGW